MPAQLNLTVYRVKPARLHSTSAATHPPKLSPTEESHFAITAMASATSATAEPLGVQPQVPIAVSAPAQLSDTAAVPAKGESLIRLDPPIGPLAVPFHPALAPQQEESKCPQIGAFVKDALDQAKAFAGAEIPSFSLKSTKKSPGAAVEVEVLTKTLEAEGGKKQFWVARRSVHAGQKEAGDASWDEFDSGLRINHSTNEMAYTPNVKEAAEVCRWIGIGDVEGWKKIDMAGTHLVPSRVLPTEEVMCRN